VYSLPEDGGISPECVGLDKEIDCCVCWMFE